MSRKSFVNTIILPLLLPLLVSCNLNEKNNIVIGVLDGPSVVSFVQMMDQMPYIDGKKVEYVVESDPRKILDLMKHKKLDFAILPTVTAVNAYNKGSKYRMVACPVWGTFYVVTRKPYGKWDDLEGKTVSVAGKGGTADVLLQNIIRGNHINNVNIDYTFGSNNDLAQALLLGKTDIAIVSEPLVSVLLAQDRKFRVMKRLDGNDISSETQKNYYVQTAFLVSDAFSGKYPYMVRDVCMAYTSSCNYISEQPLQAAELMVKHHFSANVQVAQISIPLCDIKYVAAFAIEKELFDYLSIFYRYNPESIGGKLPSESFIYQTYL